MKKLFISQHMAGRTEDEITKERESIVQYITIQNLLEDEVTVIDSVITNAPEGANSLWYLSKSIEKLAEADAAYFAFGWKSARGCVIEHECAEKYGVKIFE